MRGEFRSDGRLRAVVEAAADELKRYPFEVWHYGDSIGFEGLLAAAELLGEPRYSDFALGVVGGWIPRARPYRELDNTAPGHAMVLLAERSGDRRILDAARGLADFLVSRRTVRGVYIAFERAPLLEPYGGEELDREGRTLLDEPGAGVFVDCLHFDAPFLTHLGVALGDQSLVELGVEQACAMIELLQEADGLFAHFYLERTGQTYGQGWGRGQGWALLGLLDVLELLPADHRGRQPVADAIERLASVLTAAQERDGHWRTPLGDSTAPVETSTASFVAAGFPRAARLGLLSDAGTEAGERAWQAAVDCVSADGTIRGVSAAVWASTAISHYGNVPTGFQVPWGHGPFLLAAAQWMART